MQEYRLSLKINLDINVWRCSKILEVTLKNPSVPRSMSSNEAVSISLPSSLKNVNSGKFCGRCCSFSKALNRLWQNMIIPNLYSSFSFFLSFGISFVQLLFLLQVSSREVLRKHFSEFFFRNVRSCESDKTLLFKFFTNSRAYKAICAATSFFIFSILHKSH